MKPYAQLSAAMLISSGCIFGNAEADPPPGDPPSDMGQDAASDFGSVDTGNTVDAGHPDLPPTPDVAVADAGEDLSSLPDVPPPVREPSAVCVEGVESSFGAAHRYRLRANTTNARVTAGYVVPGEGADVLGEQWSQWETFELWVDMDFTGSEVLVTEAVVPDPTGIVSVPPSSGLPGALITRRSAQKCIFTDWSEGATGSLDCANAWGAEVSNLIGTPRYLWFGEGGTITSMPADDLDPLGQRITVTWCAQNPDVPGECLPLEYGGADIRANRGPNVLLSDALGRAYIWDSVQNIDATTNQLDCVTPPTAPVPLMLQGAPVMFVDADLVRVGNDDFLVHQTTTEVSVHPLGTDLQPLAAQEQLPNSGSRPYFDATSDGVRIAATTAVGSDARVFAFGTGGGTRDVVIDDDATFDAKAIGVAIRQDQVAVLAGGSGFFNLVVNGFRMWQ